MQIHILGNTVEKKWNNIDEKFLFYTSVIKSVLNFIFHVYFRILLNPVQFCAWKSSTRRVRIFIQIESRKIGGFEWECPFKDTRTLRTDYHLNLID